ncbi:efflux RND transporter periplasmic adaptor subunit [uncultured Lamprocystis sp.]|jgi:RND family efflux transporter MFP subunit|uniref:efflux RND transporter periplasmic adaptor subunit n=1 Tax=uncultured Lamprocystis sp. TaxID=543132 RepID=UPI0025ED92D6|nr:efflux RND transporter periplasmic adaptor subunit [uncultured Lamprocystis sp.]
MNQPPRFVLTFPRYGGTPLGVVLLILMATTLTGCTKPEPVAAAIRPVLLTQVLPGSGTQTAMFAGEVKPRYESDLAFRIGGKIVSRGVDAGARVRKGQVLARLDPADLALQTESAEAQVAAARVDHEFAQAELNRHENLLKQKFISASALDAKRNAMKATQAKLEQTQANLAVTRNQAAYAQLLAPEDGVITAVAAEAGQVVAAGQLVMRYAREREREVEIAVPEARIAEVQQAQQIAVMLAADPDTRYRGQVREVSPAVDPVTRTFAVRVSVIDPTPAMQWGMTAKVVLADAGSGTASLLPSTALHQASDGRPALWVYDPAIGTVSLRPVAITQYREDGVVIAAGLTAGEWVVATGANKLHEGQQVRPYVGAGRPVPPEPTVPAAAATARVN